MNIDHFFFRMYAVAKSGSCKFLGSAFPITVDGGLLTCRHVIQDVEEGELAVHDNVTGRKIHVKEVRTPSRPALDLAYLPQALPGGGRSFIPILPRNQPLLGRRVYSYGFYAPMTGKVDVEQGFFSGRVVNLLKDDSDPPIWTITLPYPIIEGMSGSAVLISVNGPKLVGVAFGNQSSRILAWEVTDYEEERFHYRESVQRIVEFGRAYHCDTVIQALSDLGASGFRVTEDVVPMPGLVPPPGAA